MICLGVSYQSMMSCDVFALGQFGVLIAIANASNCSLLQWPNYIYSDYFTMDLLCQSYLLL